MYGLFLFFSTMNICFVFSLYSMKYFFVHFSFKYSPKWNSRGREPFNKAKLISEIATDSKFALVFLVGYQTKVILVINYESVFFSAAYDRPNSYQLRITFTFYTSNMVPNIFIRKPMKTLTCSRFTSILRCQFFRNLRKIIIKNWVNFGKNFTNLSSLRLTET